MFRRKSSTIAVDIGLESVRVVQMRRDRDAIYLAQSAGTADALTDEVDVDARMSAQFNRLKRIVKQKGLHGSDATIAFQPPDVSFAIVDVPNETFGITSDEWNTMLRCEAARAAKLDPDQLEVAAWPLPSNRKDGGTIMVTYAKREVVKQIRELVARCNLKLVRIDLLPLVLLRAGWRSGLPGNPTQPNTALWGVLEIGARSSVLVIGQGPNCIYVRDLGVTADLFTREFAKALEIDYSAAERIKRDLGAPQSAYRGEHADSQGSEIASAATMLAPVAPQLATGRGMRSGLRTLTAEARRAFTYAIERFADSSPSGLYLTGGGSRLHGLPEHLTESLGVPVECLTPRAFLDSHRQAKDVMELDDPRYVVAAGLALGDFE